MFSPKLIQKKVDKAAPAPACRSDNPPKRKRKNGKAETPSFITKKKNRDSLKPPTSTTSTTTTGFATTRHTGTDINKNKLNRAVPPYNPTAKREKVRIKRRKRRYNSKAKTDALTEGNEAKQCDPNQPVPHSERDEAKEECVGSEGHNTSPLEHPETHTDDPETPVDKGSDSECCETERKMRNVRISHAKKGSRNEAGNLASSRQRETRIDESSDSELSTSKRKKKKGRKSPANKWNRYKDEMETSDRNTSRNETPEDKSTDSEHSTRKKKTKKGRNLTSNKWNRYKDEMETSDRNTSRNETPEDESTDSDHSGTRIKTKTRENTNQSPQRGREMADILVGECLATTTTESGTVVAALAPHTTLYLQGCVVVCPVVGRVEVLGYVLQEGESQPVHSLPTCSLLGITATEGRELDGTLAAVLAFPPNFVQELVEKKCPVTLVEVRGHSAPRVDLLVGAGWEPLTRLREWRWPWSTVQAAAVRPATAHHHRLLHLPPQWREAVHTVVTNWQCGAVPRVVVGGGKGVGKSTLFKYLVNSLLSVRPGCGVLCLDLDPGQPELCLPSSLCLTRLTRPLLGPAYTHHLAGLARHSTQLLVGDISPQFVLQQYRAAVQQLCAAAAAGQGEAAVVVNTMGWTQGTGLAIMLDLVRLVRPTHLMQLQDHRPARNFPFPLEAAAVAAARGGLDTRVWEGLELHYSLSLLPSAAPASLAPHVAQPRVQRELRVLAEAGLAMETGHRVTLPWAGLALHVCREQVPPGRLLQTLNAQLVALCRLDAGVLHQPRQDLPSLLTLHAGPAHLLGWGVVVGVDPEAGLVHLATQLAPDQVVGQVNALVMPRIHLPPHFYTLFSLGQGPYLEAGCREGSGRLRVGRRIMPRTNKL